MMVMALKPSAASVRRMRAVMSIVVPPDFDRKLSAIYPPPLRGGRIKDSILATRSCARALPTTKQIVSPPAIKGGEAPKGACQPCPRKLRQTLPLVDATRLRATIEGAPAFPRFTAALATGYHPDGSAPEPGFLKTRRTRS